MLIAINIKTDYPFWMIILCFLLGAIYASVLYYKESKLDVVAKWLKNSLMVFRFLAVSIIAFLLLSPFIKTIFNKTEKPIIIFAQDNSNSLLVHQDSAFYANNYLKELNTLKEKLEENYEVKSFTFGEKVKEEGVINFSEKTTNIAELFEAVETKFYNRNIGALILSSDGIYNEGFNPVYNAENTNYPIYTIALGDTTIQPDIVLKEAIANKITFLNNKFPIEILGLAQSCKGEKTTLTVAHKNKVVFTKTYDITKNNQLIEEAIILEAKEKGVQHYTISFSALANEVSTKNNSKDVYIEVLDGRQHILLLAHAPHPDLKALKTSIKTNENYEVSTKYFDDFDGNFEPYNLVVLHQFPTYSPVWLRKISEKNISVLYILGNQSNLNAFNQFQPHIKVLQSNQRSNATTPALTENFPLFNLSEATLKQSNNFPPLESIFGTYLPQEKTYVLFNQKIGNVATEQPLMAFFQEGKNKAAFISGEGLWRWRLNEFAKNNNHQAFDEIINKTVQFLSVKDNKDKFRVIVDNQFNETQEIIFNAELYNNSYELVNTPEIKLELKNEAGVNYQFVFNKTGNSYVLNAGILPVGNYSYLTSTTFSGEQFVVKGQLQINPLLVELNNTVANHQLLQNVANKYNGKMVLPPKINELEQLIKENTAISSVIYEETDIKEIIHIKWIFFLILVLIATEWFIRKRNGAY
ncbi:MAG: hypothetical protein OQJ96_05550 [Flavobacteriales bacterium]|nr:hypothetical protein [Flavobacteriales bacterium]MCW8914022.1 hypothetical protein [Flavobacteriales bacterium]MCW8938080.1 hypothetical protein [Flavobacteriales bacterium]MCW8969402.1 hypothetical protein [Flavobacteriales bacterium]MCW8991113.1 hypothetical protein [Flavobacteriales bacterium]